MNEFPLEGPTAKSQRSTPKIFGLPSLLLVAVISVGFSIFAAHLVLQAEQEKGVARFEIRMQRVVTEIHNRMGAYAQLLRGGTALFNASDAVSRSEWKTYVESIDVDKFYPGIQGIGFSEWVRPEDADAHVERIVSEGFGEYRIWPEGERSAYTAIVFLEPFDFRNRRAFGFDMYSEPVRRAAMERARDTGKAAMSGMVTLKQETGEDVQAGFLTYVPVYRQGQPLTSVADRRAALTGFVYSPFRMNDLLHNVLGQDGLDVALSIYDGSIPLDQTLMYQSGEALTSPLYKDTRRLEIDGRTWTVRVASLPAFEHSIGKSQAITVLIFGLIVSLLLIAGIRIMTMTGTRAVSLAKEMTSARLESEGRFRGAFETAPHGMALVGTDGRWIMVNRALCRLLGYSEEQLLRIEFQDITHPDDLDDDLELVNRVLAGEMESYQIEKRYIRKDGTVISILLSVVLVRNESGAPVHFVAQILDLTDRLEAQRQLMQSQKMDAVGQLTGGLAHDFNNLLAIIIGNLQLLQRTLKGDEKANHRAASAVEAAERGAEITQRLLAFSRRQTLEAKVTNVNGLIAGMAGLLQGTLGEHVKLQTELCEEDWRAKIDSNQLETAILNLAVNARDAMPHGGHLTIDTSSVQLDEDYTSANREVAAGEYIAVSVSDNGSGMPAHVANQVFQPFFTTKEVGKGTGLGLSMVYGFAKQSDGHIEIYSEEGVGTKVTLYLPRDSESALENPTISLYAEEFPRGTETVLVVEDNNGVREVTVAQLEDLGYTVLEAENGLKALAMLANHPDIAIMYTDIIMPGGMNGAELAAQASARFADLKIVYTSGFAETAILQGSGVQALGVLLTKPVTKSNLANAFRHALDDVNSTASNVDEHARLVGDFAHDDDGRRRGMAGSGRS